MQFYNALFKLFSLNFKIVHPQIKVVITYQIGTFKSYKNIETSRIVGSSSLLWNLFASGDLKMYKSDNNLMGDETCPDDRM